MSEIKTTTVKPLTIREFVHGFMADEDIFLFLPEFSFIKPLAVKWKKQNCACGLGEDIKKTIEVYNDMVRSLDEQLVAKVSAYFAIPNPCFAIQSIEKHEVKCY